MHVSIICPDLSNNCLGRSYVLAQLIDINHSVEIIGPKIGENIWAPVKDEYDYKVVNSGPRIHQLIRDTSDILSEITGDVVYASKPRFASYGIGLLDKIRNKRPLILDVDDWESGLNYGRRGKWIAPIWGIPALFHHNTYYYTRSLEAMSGLADAHTVSTKVLQNQFGGTVIEHARDTKRFDPDKYDQEDARAEYSISQDEVVVMFSGTPRPHKGVQDLAEAVSNIEYNVRLVIVGADKTDYVNRIQKIGGDSTTIFGPQPFSEIPKWIASSDIIAIPQRSTPETRGQLPAKVFDAMAMAKPIIATNVSDLPRVVEDCGYIVQPNKPSEIREAITELARNPEMRRYLGESARKKCIEEYSYDALAPKLDEIIRSAAK